ncbi:RING finger domain-containing protein [Linnemannia elongata AG-77]|uniref:RBR-type E3 ubiquitin transferase n=1 Tax=Linnemannia elongata AG-77 TaxID=1314771 RepID=A0A197JJU3_9FUNG|nr:RING finger domain-containing protein [Linnemannia elongata AG-77]
MSSGSLSDDDFAGSSDIEDDYYGSDDEGSEMDFEQTEDIGFSDLTDEKERKKAYEVDFKVVPLPDIISAQANASNHVAGILDLSTEQAAALLRSFKWNKERLIERYMENPQEILDQAGVVLDSDKITITERPTGFLCEICYDDSPVGGALGLSCGHVFCHGCYEQYLTQKINEEGECRRILCPESGCSVLVDEANIKRIISPSTLTKYRRLQDKAYIADLDNLRWCPAPNCENAVECRLAHHNFDTVVPTVSCACGHDFCFGCGLDNHQPASCGLVKMWQKKCADDSETANWISANTKECGKCQSTIEKNGGCNHMTCRKCKYEFCWVCMGPWSEHGSSWYNCNRFEENSSSDARDQQAKSRASLERYLHYYNRFANHEQSAKLDRDLYMKTEKKMEEMQRTSELSWIEVQFLKKAVDVLTSCRMTLRWTYAFAYYLIKDNITELFEDNQRDLEVAVEALSELLEKPIEKEKIAELRQQVLNKTVYVASRREVVLDDTAKGLVEGRWKYFCEVPSIIVGK